MVDAKQLHLGIMAVMTYGFCTTTGITLAAVTVPCSGGRPDGGGFLFLFPLKKIDIARRIYLLCNPFLYAR
jgi:hypothetical protein